MADYGVAANDIPDLNNAIERFEGMKGDTGNVIATKKTATQGLVDSFDAADASLEVIDDLLVNSYDETNPDLVEKYEQVRLQDNISVHHTGIYALLTGNDGKGGIEGGFMEVVELGKKATSDIDGYARIERMYSGKYHVAFSAKGYADKTLVLEVTRGEHLEVTVELEVLKEVVG